MSKICELLSQLASANRAIASENEAIENYQTKISMAEQELVTKTTKIEKQKDANKLKRREAQKLEGEISALDKKIGDATANQSQASNNDDYATWTKRIAEYKEKVAEIEDNVLEMLEICDQNESQQNELDQQIANLKQETTIKKEDYLSSIEAAKERKADLISRRDAIFSQLGGSFKSFYDRLYAKYGETTVVPIKKESCGGCYMKLTIDLIAQVRTSEDPITCKSCNRVLYTVPLK